MNYYKIQQEIIKAYAERDRKLFNVNYGFATQNGEDFIGVTIGTKDCANLGMIFIPEEEFVIDIEKVFQKPPVSFAQKMMDSDGNPATLTNEIRKIDKTTLNVFKVEGEEEDLWVDSKLLKYFDLKNSSFIGKDYKSPLVIKEDYTVVGVVLAVNHSINKQK